MSDPWLASFPATLPEVTLTPLANGGAGSAVTCRELQWWFLIPEVGDRFGGVWYDRATGEITRVQELARPIVDLGTGDGAVRIDIDEWVRTPGGVDPPAHQQGPGQVLPASWLASHPGSEIVVDDLVFQRRNCTGRDEIALTVYGLAL